MQPQSHEANLGVEQKPIDVDSKNEKLVNLPTPETVLDSGAEKFEQKADLGAIRSDVSLTATIPTPVIDDKIVDNNTTFTGNPIIAGDDDLIEKEWVDKAKKIVAQTQNDPHKREKEVSKLQVDYIKKRFGRELGVTTEQGM